MKTRTLPAIIRDGCRRLVRAERGNVVITFALAFIPIIGLTGAAVDYSRANAVRTAMQAAADSTALAISKTASTQTAAALQSQASTYFNATFTRADARSLQVTASYSTTNGSSVRVLANATVNTEFMGILGINQIPVGVSSTTAWGSTRLRVALVLDNTGSMADDGKMAALITATNNLLAQLKAAVTTTGDVYVSIIPFVKDVAVDPINSTSTWVDWTDWEAPPANSMPDADVGPGDSCPYSSRNDGYTCTSGPATGSATTRNIPSSGTYKGYICPGADGSGRYYNGCYNSTTYSCTGSSCSCSGHGNCSCSGSGSNKSCGTSNGYYEHAWVVNAHSTWTGCLVDRGNSGAPSAGNYDTNVAAPTTTNTATLFPAEQYSYCPQAVLPLSYNWSAMATLVNGMTPAGNTNQAIGLAHGWMSLVGGGPYPAPPAMDANYTYQQVIILLTDGLNTQDRWYTSQSSIDARQQLTCNNINAAGITLYAIQVNTGGDPTSTLLQNCAGSPGRYPDSSKFFLLTSANQIVTTFNAIGTNLSKLRVAK